MLYGIRLTYLGKSTSTFNIEIVSHKIKVLKTGVHKALVPEYEWLCGGPWLIQAMRGATGVVAVEHIGGLLWQWQPLTSGNSPRHIYTTRALQGILHSRDSFFKRKKKRKTYYLHLFFLRRKIRRQKFNEWSFFRFKIYFSTYFYLKHHKNLLKPPDKPKTLETHHKKMKMNQIKNIKMELDFFFMHVYRKNSLPSNFSRRLKFIDTKNNKFLHQKVTRLTTFFVCIVFKQYSLFFL